ncbi:MAG: cysteine hydrolase [Bacteroidales bacterium]|jgi:nicotinamidase-related amidase|nr:cysteine hydrolase [Bacteroidales bacterium]
MNKVNNKPILSILLNNSKQVELDNTVLVLNEFQNQWTKRGLYHWLIKRELKKRNVVDNTLELLKHWRSKNLMVIHAPIIQDPKNKKGFLAHISDAGFFTKGTWKAEFTEGTYVEGDIVLEGRYTFNVFEGSDFEDILNSMNVKTFLICGFTTSLCIKMTVEAAKKKGYDFIIINDCSATFTGWLQKLFDRKFKDNIVHSDEVIKELKTMR